MRTLSIYSDCAIVDYLATLASGHYGGLRYGVMWQGNIRMCGDSEADSYTQLSGVTPVVRIAEAPSP